MSLSLGGIENTSLDAEHFVPSWDNSINVSFHPKQMDLYAIIDGPEDSHTSSSPSSFPSPSDHDRIPSVHQSTSTCKQKSVFMIRGDSIDKFYIGSVAVIGLFILFRMLQKS